MTYIVKIALLCPIEIEIVQMWTLKMCYFHMNSVHIDADLYLRYRQV